MKTIRLRARQAALREQEQEQEQEQDIAGGIEYEYEGPTCLDVSYSN